GHGGRRRNNDCRGGCSAQSSGRRLEATWLDQACRAQLMASECAAGPGGQCEHWGPAPRARGVFGAVPPPHCTARGRSWALGGGRDAGGIGRSAKDVASACAVKRSG